MLDSISNNIILYVNIFLYSITLFVYQKINKKITHGTFILGLYTFISIVSFLLFSDTYSVNFFKTDLTLFPFLYLYFIIILFSIPILKIDLKKVDFIVPVKSTIIFPFSLLVIFVFSFSLFEVIENFNSLWVNLAVDENYANELYLESRKAKSSLGVNIIGVLSAALRDYPQFLLFYLLTFKKKNKLLIGGMLLATAVSVLSGLVFGLRGNVIFMFFSSLFCYLFFNKYYTKRLKKVIRVSTIATVMFLAIPFIIISTSRFETGYSEYKDSGFASKMYAGQSMIYFNLYGLDNNGIRYGDRTANFFKGFLFNDVPKNFKERRLKYTETYINDEVFSTFVGEFTLDYGSIVTFFIFLLFAIFTSRLKLIKVAYLHQVLVLYFIWNVLTYGIFLFPYADTSGNIRIVIFCMLYFIFKFNRTSIYKT